MAQPRGREYRKGRPIRFTDREWDDLSRRATAAGITRSEFVRSAALANRVASRANDRVLKALFDIAVLVKQRHPGDTALLTQIESLIASAT